MNNRSFPILGSFAAAMICLSVVAAAQDAPVVSPRLAAFDDPMASEGLYTVPESGKYVEPALIEALKKAAAQPDQETRLQTLQAVAEHRMVQLTDQVKVLLGDERVLVRTAAIHAAASLGLTDTAAVIRPWLTSIKPNSQDQVALLLEADRALAGFNDRETMPVWLARVKDSQAPVALRISALRALRDMHAGFPAEVIAVAVNADEPAEVRFAAADVIAVCGHLVGFDRGGELFAPYDKMLAGSLADRLVAARMLTGEAVPAAVPLLQRAAGDKEPAVQAIALAELKQRGAGALTMPIIAASAKSPDPKVRLLAIEGLPLHMVRQSVDLAGAAMNDPHPDNRAAARASLVALDKTEMGKWVRMWLQQATDSLVSFDASKQAELWGEAEQWPLLARDLNDRSVAQTLTKFLNYPRTEVVVAAVKSLRSLNVEATHQPVLDLFTQIVGNLETNQPVADPTNEVARQAAMTLGIWRMKEADAILRHGIKKEHPLGTARAACIWSLGLIHEGQFDGGLAGLLNQRINDTRGMIPESDDVRKAGIITLGRMKGTQSLGILRQHLNSQDEGVDMQRACQWAIQQITGQPEPAPAVSPSKVTVQFLSPMHNAPIPQPMPAGGQ